MARLFLTSGQTFSTVGAGLVTDVFGTISGTETVTVAANGDALFDASFNAGGDIINIEGNAGNYHAAISGSSLVLTSAGGANITIPFGTVGTTINFADAAGRTLILSGSSVLLGGQTVTTGAGVDVTAGTSPGGGNSADEPYIFADYELTEGSDLVQGTTGNDTIRAGQVQISEIGSVANSLSTADRVLGGLGTDHLFAILSPEFFSANGGFQVDVQPIIRSVEIIEIESRDTLTGGHGGEVKSFNPGMLAKGEDAFTQDTIDSYGGNQIVIVDAKDMRDVDHIGSYNSDGDLVIENLNTKTSGDAARNTEAITITMDHTDNFNSDCDASDLHVYFDDDYLLAGQDNTTSQANYWLLDEDSPDYVLTPLLNIERNGVAFDLDGTTVTLFVDMNDLNGDGTTETLLDIPDSWEGFRDALQEAIDDQIALGNTFLNGLSVVVDPGNPRTTFNTAGVEVTVPAISIIDANGREFTNLQILSPDDATGAFDIFGRTDTDPSETFDNPITVNIELHKVGRNGEGGDLIVGGKNGDKGIEVFNVFVEGNDPSDGVARPSSLGTLASTGGALEEVYITTADDVVDGEMYASLEIRDGFGDNYSGWDNPSLPHAGSIAPYDLRLVDADDFLGDLALGTWHSIEDLDTLLARGGGNVTFYGWLTGDEQAQPYQYLTGSGNDLISIYIDGDALDFAQSSVLVDSGAGDDYVWVGTDLYYDDEVVNQSILHNVEINTGDGNDTIVFNAGARGVLDINAGAGNDVIYGDGNGEYCEDYAAWAFNYDQNQHNDDGSNLPNSWGWHDDGTLDADIQGVELAPAYLGGARLTVSLSGAGVDDLADGGGVMAMFNGADADGWAADGFVNGYENTVTISQLASGRTYFGDQRDINAAIMRAINESSVLSKLLAAEITENNSLVIYSLTGGDFQPGDLEITIDQANWANASQGNGVLAEFRAVTGNSAATITDVWGVASPTTASMYTGTVGLGTLGPAEGALGFTQGDWDDYYAGLGVDEATLLWEGKASNSETDTVYNGGSGDDLIVMSTDSRGGGTPDMEISPGNALLNYESNETIVMQGFFGNDTIMNFETAHLAQPPMNGDDSSGLDFLNYLAYLTSQEDNSINDAQNPDSNVSHHIIPVTLDYQGGLAGPGTPVVDQNANEVTVVRFDATATNTWAGLSSTVIAALFNNSNGADPLTADYGNFLDQNFMANDEYVQPVDGTDPLIGTAKGILMVENGANLGEYKVFELSWNGEAATDADGTHDGVVSAQLVGTLDFGTSLDGLHEVNLVGSVSYGEVLTMGIENWLSI